MKRSLIACAAALACVISLAVPAVAAGKNAVVSAVSESTAYAKIYEYKPERTLASGKTVYGNTLTVGAVEERVLDDNGNLYRITDSSLLTDKDAFVCTIRTGTNGMAVQSVRQCNEPIAGAGACYTVILESDAMGQDLTVYFTASYRAKKEVQLPVRSVGKNGGAESELLVKAGAKIKLDYRLTINEDSLFNTTFLTRNPQWYGDLFYFKDVVHPIGAEDLVLTAKKDQDSDYTWEDSDIIVAAVDGELAVAPKLSTCRADTGRDHKAAFGELYTRYFRNTPKADGVMLTLTNPFLTYDGAETVPHQDVHIYEPTEAGDLRDITSRFRYQSDADGRGAFTARVNQLGNYIFSSKELK